MTPRAILSPLQEIMPDRCTPEYERVLAEFGVLLPYRRACTLLGTFFPVGDLPTIDTISVGHCKSAPGWRARLS